MRKGVTDRNQKERVRKQAGEVRYPGQIVVSLGNVPIALSQKEDLADMKAEEIVELRVAIRGGQYVHRGPIMKMGEEVLPDRLFERLRAFTCNDYRVLMGSFLRILPFPEQGDETAPVDRRHDKREIPVAVGPDTVDARQLLEQDRRAGSR